jgi:hypothetical protein
VSWNLPDANQPYILYLEDLVDNDVQEIEVTSNSNRVVTHEFTYSDLQFDRKFAVKFYDADHENVIEESELDFIRPYTNPLDLGTTASEISEYRKWELIARSLIDTQIEQGFYNRKWAIQSKGNGLDYMPVWRDAGRVLKVYQDNVLIYDVNTPETNAFDYKISPDKSAIIKVFTGLTEIISTAQINMPISRGDYVYDNRNYGTFTKNSDYVFVVEEGPKSVPTDIKYATEMLIDDLKCGKLDYYQRYVTAYNTDQFRVQFDKSSLEGTGNVIVDKIIDKYLKSITRVGVI